MTAYALVCMKDILAAQDSLIRLSENRWEVKKTCEERYTDEDNQNTSHGFPFDKIRVCEWEGERTIPIIGSSHVA